MKETQKKSPYTIYHILYTVCGLAFLGFLDATYLTIQHYTNRIPPCSLTHGCETVLTSKFATAGSIPLALFGVGFYLAVLFLTLGFIQTKNKKLFWMLLGLVQSGFVISLVLVGIQAFNLHAFCMYCLGAEGINTVLFGLICWEVFKKSSP